jgi:hypothetical protein
MISVITMLSRMEALEDGLAELYEWLSKRFSDSAVSGFFIRLSLDEKAHRDLVRYQVRMVRSDRKLFPDVEADLAAVDSVRRMWSRALRSTTFPLFSAAPIRLSRP